MTTLNTTKNEKTSKAKASEPKTSEPKTSEQKASQPKTSAPKTSDPKIWNTKYGPRRVRHDPPTLEEAIFAARGLTDDLEAQVEIAASLMEVAPDEVRAALKKTPAARKGMATLAFTNRSGAERAVVVERKPPRRVAAAGRTLTGRSFS
jgi:hypothetical protein